MTDKNANGRIGYQNIKEDTTFYVLQRKIVDIDVRMQYIFRGLFGY